MQMIILSPAEAEAVTGEYAPGRALEPIEVQSGKRKGKFAVPARVLDDEHLTGGKRTALEAAKQVDIGVGAFAAS